MKKFAIVLMVLFVLTSCNIRKFQTPTLVYKDEKVENLTIIKYRSTLNINETITEIKELFPNTIMVFRGMDSQAFYPDFYYAIIRN